MLGNNRQQFLAKPPERLTRRQNAAILTATREQGFMNR
jgi:hypothetical protein